MEWIYCADRLPELKQHIIFCVSREYIDGGGLELEMYLGHYYWPHPDDAGVQIANDNGQWFGIGNGNEQVYAWMPAPEPAPMR